MSNQPVPQPPSPDNARPTADWSPAPLSAESDASYAGRGAQPSPSSPLRGAGRLPKVDVGQFAPGRSPWPILAVVAAVVVAALIIYTTTWRPSAKPTASSSPIPSASQSADPGTTTPEPNQPFVGPDGQPTGSWEVVRHQWDDTGLEVLIRIKVTKGTLDYTLNVIDVTGMVRISAQASSLTPGLDFQPISAGQEVLGWARFNADRGESTLALVSGLQEQLSALPVAG
jgi:hypothetical protein